MTEGKSKEEKMRIMNDAVAYAKNSAYECLDCIGPGGWNYDNDTLNCRGSRNSDVVRINTALEMIGLTPEEVDAATEDAGIVECGGPLGLSEGCIDSCTNVYRFLEVVEKLL